MGFEVDDLTLDPDEEVGLRGTGGTLSYTSLNGEAHLAPIDLPRMVIKGLCCWNTVAGSVGSLIRMGMFLPISPARFKPGNLFIDGGTVSGEGAVGKKTVTFNPRWWPGGPAFLTAVSQGSPGTGPTLRTVTGPDIQTVLPSGGGIDLIDRFHRDATVGNGALPLVWSSVGGSGQAVMMRVIAGDIKDLR